MKIGVFGDSYAQHSADNSDHLEWRQYIQEINPNLTVDNYGYAGSSLYYTWKQFQDNQHKYDKVIVCFTTPNRLWLPHLQENWNLEHVHGLSILKYRKFKHTAHLKVMRKAIKLYYAYIANDREQRDIWQLQIEDIKRKRPDGLYLTSFRSPTTISDYIPLHDISLLDGNLMGNHRDPRANHFNDKNCRLFAAKIETWIQTNQFSLDIEDFSK